MPLICSPRPSFTSTCCPGSQSIQRTSKGYAGRTILIHEAFINAEKTGPLPVAEYSALLMHSTRGKCYATSEFGPLLQEAGFAGVSCVDTVADRGVISARLPRRS